VPVFQPLEEGCPLARNREIGVGVPATERAEVGAIRGSKAAQPVGFDIVKATVDIPEVIIGKC